MANEISNPPNTTLGATETQGTQRDAVLDTVADTHKALTDELRAAVQQVKMHSSVAKVIGGLLLVALTVIGVNYVIDEHNRALEQAKIIATLQQQFQQVGKSAIAGNTQGTQAQVQQQASDVFGPAVLAAMTEQNAHINSLTTAVAITQASVTTLQQQKQQTFAPTQQASTGALTGYQMQESRGDGPALSSVNIYYDPTKKDPNAAFLGTQWTHFQETFKTSVGNWERQKDGGYRTTVNLSRTVTKPDPNDPTKTVTLGTEQIPITDAGTVFSPKGLVLPSAIVQPRWTASVGLSNNKQNGYAPFAQMDYRVTDRYGAFVGTANNGLLGGVSIRLGGKK